MEKILIVDVSSVFHRAYNVLCKRMEGAVDLNGSPSVGTYGFLTTLFKTTKEFGPFSKYLFAIDVKGSTSTRKSTDKNYKSNRIKKSNDFYLDKDNLINNYLPMIDITPLGLKDYEADDIIASACKYISTTYKEGTYEIYILSGDSDLEMCIKYSTNIHFIKTQPKWCLLKNEDIYQKWGIENPNDIALLKAISGDDSDNIEGIFGYRRKKALKVYKDKSFLNQHREKIEKNLSLINLKDNLEAVPRELNVSLEILNQMFSKLNSKTLLKRADKIIKTL